MMEKRIGIGKNIMYEKNCYNSPSFRICNSEVVSISIFNAKNKRKNMIKANYKFLYSMIFRITNANTQNRRIANSAVRSKNTY